MPSAPKVVIATGTKCSCFSGIRRAYFAFFCFSLVAANSFADRMFSPKLGAKGWETVTSTAAGPAVYENICRSFTTVNLHFVRYG